MTRILIPVEDRRFGQAQVEFLSKHELAPDTHFTLLTVIVPIVAPDYGFAVPHHFLEAIATEDEAASVKLLNDLAKELHEQFPNAVIETLIETGRPVYEICRVAKDGNYDWIVLGSHGRSGLDKFFLGSVSLSVINHAHCSVSIVRLDSRQKLQSTKAIAETAKV
jgi:nucleotide-binding universal stress UspA family protein